MIWDNPPKTSESADRILTNTRLSQQAALLGLENEKTVAPADAQVSGVREESGIQARNPPDRNVREVHQGL